MNTTIRSWKEQLDLKTEALKDAESIDLVQYQELESKMQSIYKHLDENFGKLPTEELKKKQLEFRDYTNHFFKHSYLFTRAREWPRGYPGDYKTLEKNYLGIPIVSKGIGMYIDNYFLNNTLARGVRERKETLSHLILKELGNRDNGQRVLNIGCGSSREIFDIGKTINDFAPKMTFLDYDQEALNYSQLLLHNGEIDITDFKFMKYNALKLASAERTEATFGKQDIIYSAGLFDYVQTDGLKKMIHSLYHLLDEGGVIIAPFKDKENYQTYDYHWFADWSYFYQRTIEDVARILETSSGTVSEIIPCGTPAINFFILRK